MLHDVITQMVHLHCSNFSLDTLTFIKPADFKVERLPLVARNRKV